jgi:transcription elongation factor Elf1
MNKIYNCIYCNSACTVSADETAKKLMLDCPKCGKLEATKTLLARLEAKYELEKLNG